MVQLIASYVPTFWRGCTFTGDGVVNAQDLNLVGDNWRSGEDAAAASHERVPRAPLAAIRKATAIVDITIDHVTTAEYAAAGFTLALPADNSRIAYGFEAQRTPHDAVGFRRGSVQRDEALAQGACDERAQGPWVDADNEVKLVEALFARLRIHRASVGLP